MALLVKYVKHLKKKWYARRRRETLQGVLSSFKLRLAEKSWITKFLGSCRTSCQHPSPRHPGFISLSLHFCTPPPPPVCWGSQVYRLAGSKGRNSCPGGEEGGGWNPLQKEKTAREAKETDQKEHGEKTDKYTGALKTQGLLVWAWLIKLIVVYQGWYQKKKKAVYFSRKKVRRNNINSIQIPSGKKKRSKPPS